MGGGSGNGNGGPTVGENTKITVQRTKYYSSEYMSMCVTNLKDHEGFKNSMYKDQDGNITVGIGHLLANADMAASLPFSHRHVTHGHGDDMEHEVSASKSDIKSAYDAYKKDSKSIPGNLHLSNDDVIGQCVKDVQVTESGLRGIYSGYDGFSNSRKTALVDMGFNLEIPKLKNIFTKFNDAVNRGDWDTAANGSHRTLNQRGDTRNRDTAGS